MKKYLYAGSLVLLLVFTFIAGYRYGDKSSPDKAVSGKNRVLYYVDPMNPGHRYDKPGTAPCGMALEPVYADGDYGAAATPPGMVRISPAKQQLIGVRVEQVEKASGTHTIRVLGRVAADETRIYRINAFVDGWIKKVFPVSTGSLVGKNEPLVYFYAPEFLTAQQAYISLLSSASGAQAPGREGQYPISAIGTTLDKYRDILRNLGMGEAQIDEIGRTRKATQDIVIRSPARGFVLARNVSPEQRFEKGSELFRIANLSRVWILLDTYEDESRYFRPGEKVPFRYQGKVFHARVSGVLPQFDASSRTLKVRLEAENPGFRLRPDMFVDVEHATALPPAVTIPLDAVLDSGMKKTVFVERGTGLFEPREVETGRSFGDRVEVVHGLKPGERIVVSGNFLIDSESRMKSAAEGMSGTGSIDPACGMMVDEGKSRAAGLTSDYRGKTYFFCTPQCKRDFDRAPAKFTEPGAPGGSQRRESGNGGHHHD